MASVKFEKGSFYWRMFAEYYILCQDYWELEDTDEWWDEVQEKCKEFAERYNGSVFARSLCWALNRHLEEIKKGLRDKDQEG